MGFAEGFSSCFRAKSISLSGTEDEDSVTYQKCPFCRVSNHNGFDVVWENEKFVAFNDRSPSAMQHIQLIPKRHIRSVKELKGASDASLSLYPSPVSLRAQSKSGNLFPSVTVRRMEQIGTEILSKLGVSPANQKLGFHIPPFNSVNHLHLHLQGLPYKSSLRAARYPVSPGHGKYYKGFSWFVTAEQAVRILEDNKNISVFPC